MSNPVDFSVDEDSLVRDCQLWIVITSEGEVCSVASNLKDLEECAFESGKEGLSNLIRRSGEDFSVAFSNNQGKFQQIPGTSYLIANFGFILCRKKPS